MHGPRFDGSDGDPPAFDLLERLVTSASVRDRAFAASALALRRGADRDRAARLYERVREAARYEHADVRARIRDRTLDRRTFVAGLRAAPLDVRDHLVEEILNLAYPPLEETVLPRESIPYCPSGLTEILFMIERAELGLGKTFVDLGSGLGKVVSLVALLTGARCYGVELDPGLVAHACAAANGLRLDEAHFIEGDIRDVPLPAADVYFMYMPLLQSSPVVQRLAAIAATRRIVVFAQALDLGPLPWLKSVGAASYWLEMYVSDAR